MVNVVIAMYMQLLNYLLGCRLVVKGRVWDEYILIHPWFDSTCPYAFSNSQLWRVGSYIQDLLFRSRSELLTLVKFHVIKKQNMVLINYGKQFFNQECRCLGIRLCVDVWFIYLFVSSFLKWSHWIHLYVLFLWFFCLH